MTGAISVDSGGHDADISRVVPVLRLARMHPRVTALGPGTRLGVWVQGCSLSCRGCMARDTWDPRAGVPVNVDAFTTIWQEALVAGVDGLTISGGEPLDQQDSLSVFLASAARARDALRPKADLLVFTGYAADLARRTSALRHADAVVAGPYLANRPTDLVWRGSANQVLVPLTPLGHSRYDDHICRVSDRHSIQIVQGAHRTLDVIGVPRAGDLAEIEKSLSLLHVVVSDTTWHG